MAADSSSQKSNVVMTTAGVSTTTTSSSNLVSTTLVSMETLEEAPLPGAEDDNESVEQKVESRPDSKGNYQGLTLLAYSPYTLP